MQFRDQPQPPQMLVVVVPRPPLAVGRRQHAMGLVTPTIGHDACQDVSTRWNEPLVPGSPAAHGHPNAKGEAAMSRAVVARITAS